jgi:hypothetical protein
VSADLVGEFSQCPLSGYSDLERLVASARIVPVRGTAAAGNIMNRLKPGNHENELKIFAVFRAKFLALE